MRPQAVALAARRLPRDARGDGATDSLRCGRPAGAGSPERHLLRAKDLVDRGYADPLTVRDKATAAGLSPAHFSREFRRTFGESPHQYLWTQRMERAAALLRNTDRTVTEICHSVGLTSLGSFTSSSGRVLRPVAGLSDGTGLGVTGAGYRR